MEATIVEFDGMSKDPPIVVEAWAHQGKPKSAQKNKVMTDALKMVWASRRLVAQDARKILLLADDEAASHFRGNSWMASALRDLGVDVEVVELPNELREAVLRAQERQYR